jgi:hypothetical protein
LVTLTCNFSGKRVSEGVKLAHSFVGETSSAKPSNPSAVGNGDKALTAISTRSRFLGGDDVIILGFVAPGCSPRTIVIRAVGPNLLASGVSDALPNPKLKVFQGGTVLAENDDWGTGNVAQLTGAFLRGGLAQFPSLTGKDAALVLTLTPGVYTAPVRSGDGAPGVTRVEVYDVPWHFRRWASQRVAGISTPAGKFFGAKSRRAARGMSPDPSPRRSR